MKSASIAGIMILAMMSSGCAIINRGNNVTAVRSFPHVDKKPSVYLEGVQWTRSANGKNCHDLVNTDALCNRAVIQLEQTGLFEKVSRIDVGADYTLNLEWQRSLECNGWRTLMSACSCGIIPDRDTREYRLTAYIKDNKTGTIKTVQAKETGTCITQILLIPFFPFKAPIGVEYGIDVDLLNHVALKLSDATRNEFQRENIGCGGEKQGNSDLVKKLMILKEARNAELLNEQEYQQKRAALLQQL